MGRVMLGVAPDNRLAAIKLIHSQWVDDAEFRARFNREVHTSRAVSGAYTAAVLDADPGAHVPWLASVYVPGPSLREAVDKVGRLPIHSVRALAMGLASAVSDIHRVGLIHRDLKPSNVILTDDGPRVIDFGIAKDQTGESDVTHTGSVLGSPGYMSPEQAIGRPLTQASDVFSLGSMLVLAATGNGPFAAQSASQVLYKVVYEQPNLDNVAPEIRGIIWHCLQKDPARRPTAQQLMDMIGSLDSSPPWPPAVQQMIQVQKLDVDDVRQGRPPRSKVMSGGTAAAVTTNVGTTEQPTMPRGHNGYPKPKRGLVIAAVMAAVVLLAGGAVGTAALVNGGFDFGSQAAEPPTDPFADENIRKLDPCKVLSNDDFGSYGPAENPEPTLDFAGCGWGNERFTNLAFLRLGIQALGKSDRPSATLDGRPLLFSSSLEGECEVSVIYDRKRELAIKMSYVASKSSDACKPAEELLKKAIKKIETRSAPKFYLPKESLAYVDPCSLTDEKTVQPFIGTVSATKRSGLRTCQWHGSESNLSISLMAEGKSNIDSEYKKSINLGGQEVRQSKSSEDDSLCGISWRHREFDEERDENVRLSYSATSLDSSEGGQGACGTAQAITRTVLPRLSNR